MITANVIQRVFHLRYGQGTGTCFAIDFDGKQYLVTAKHVILGLKENDSVEIYFNGNWKKIKIRLIGHHPTADISVFSINQLLSDLKMEPSSNNIAYGQDAFFLGYPYLLKDEKNSQINRNFPIPLVKKAIVSCMTGDNTGNYFLLDGINNPGFSGGPVVFEEYNKREFKVAAVISGFHSVMEPTFDQNKETSITVRINTGIIIAYTIENAIDLIRQNPIGKEIL